MSRGSRMFQAVEGGSLWRMGIRQFSSAFGGTQGLCNTDVGLHNRRRRNDESHLAAI